MRNDIVKLNSKELYDFVKKIIMPEVFIYSLSEFCEKCLKRDRLSGAMICRFVIEKTSLAGNLVELEFLDYQVRNSGSKICFELSDNLIQLEYQKLMYQKNGKDSAYEAYLNAVYEMEDNISEKSYKDAISRAKTKREAERNLIKRKKEFVFGDAFGKSKDIYF